MSTAEFEAAGLYDPTAANARDRLALLEWLASRGITIEQMQRAHRDGSLTYLAGGLALEPAAGLRLAEVAALVGMSPERVEEVRFAAGLPPVDPDAPLFSPEDSRGFTTFVAAAQLFGEQPVRRFARVMGSSLARIAEAALSLFRVHVEESFVAAGTGELALAQANLGAIEMLSTLPQSLTGLLHGHLEAAMRRLHGRADTGTFAIGFIDLVGFTPLSSQLSTSELAALVERFEDTAHDVVTARDGRVVKLIGDEVMFVVVDPSAACDIALTLVERLCCDSTAIPRGGIAYGEMLLRGGDYYGPIVNLAARIAELAVPNELLVTPEVAARARNPGLRFEAAGRRLAKGFHAPVALMTLERG